MSNQILFGALRFSEFLFPQIASYPYSFNDCFPAGSVNNKFEVKRGCLTPSYNASEQTNTKAIDAMKANSLAVLDSIVRGGVPMPPLKKINETPVFAE